MWVLAITLSQGCLTRGVVDPGDPQRREASGEDDGGHDLSKDLQDVDEGLSCSEDVEERLGNRPWAYQTLFPDADDEAPTIPPAVVGETHGEVEPKCEALARGQESGTVGRLSHWPLAIGVEQVVAQQPEVGVELRHPNGDVDEVAHEVLCGHIRRPHRGVVGGTAPVLTPAELDVPVLIRLHDGEGDRREVARRVLLQDVHALGVEQGGRSHRPEVRRPRGRLLAQACFQVGRSSVARRTASVLPPA